MAPTPKKVYLLTGGEYSDYGIDAVFATNELAEEAARTTVGSRRDVEEWTVYEAVPPKQTIHVFEQGAITVFENDSDEDYRVLVLDGWDSPPFSGSVRGGVGRKSWRTGAPSGRMAHRAWGADKDKVERVFREMTRTPEETA